MAAALLTKIRRRMRYHRGLSAAGLCLLILRDGLEKFGIKIQPYYLVLEGIKQGSRPPEAAGEGYTFGFLDPSDIHAILNIPSIAYSAEGLQRRWRDGKQCFAAKHQDEIVAFTWCDFHVCSFRSHRLFLLDDNEAYLFDALTREAFRGKGLAPYIRYRCYEELAKGGKDRLYSLTFWFNLPAQRFKEKLGAQYLELWVFGDLFQRWHFSKRLRTYANRP